MRLVARGAAVLLGTLLLVVVVHTALSPFYGVYRYDTSSALVVSAVVALTLVPLTLALGPVARALEQRPWWRRVLVAAVLAGLLCLQLRIGWAIRVAPGWDAGMVAGTAERLALGLPDDPSQQQYVAWYPNNAFIVALLHSWDDLALATGHPDLWAAGVVLVAIAMTTAVALAYLAARRLGGPVTAYLTLALALVFVGLSPWSAVTYSDTLTMPFPALVLYLFSLERRRTGVASRAALWAAMGLATWVGCSLKPTAVFALAAAVVVALVVGAHAWRRSARVFLACGAASAAGLVVGALVVGQVVAWQGMEPAREAAAQRLDVTHFLKMGAQQSPGVHNDYFGGYSEADVIETRELPLEDRPRENVESYASRVAEMGPLGYARFLERKAVWTLGDGSFFAWGEGTMSAQPTPFLATDPTSARVQRWFGLHGDRYAATFSLWQGTWLVVLLLVAGAGLARTGSGTGRTQLGPVPTMARISLLMLAAFLLLFEARARYLYLYLPYFLVLAALTLSALAPALSGWVRARGRPAR